MTTTSGQDPADTAWSARLGRQIVDLMVLAAGGIGLALPLILPLG